jgi:hypothetical protein
VPPNGILFEGTSTLLSTFGRPTGCLFHDLVTCSAGRFRHLLISYVVQHQEQAYQTYAKTSSRRCPCSDSTGQRSQQRELCAGPCRNTDGPDPLHICL